MSLRRRLLAYLGLLPQRHPPCYKRSRPFRRLPQFAGFAALLASTGCTALTFQAPRPNFPTDVKIQTACIEYHNTAEAVSAGMAKASAAGWRVMALGARTTSFLIFGVEDVVVCYERRIDSPTDQDAVPKTVPGAIPSNNSTRPAQAPAEAATDHDSRETGPAPAQPSVVQEQQPHQAGNTGEARRTLARTLAGACDSGDSHGCYDLGVLEHQSGNLAEAKRLFAKACDGGEMGGCNNLGLLEKQSGNLAIAKRLYVKACNGGAMRACTNLGALEKQAGNLAEARRLFTKACDAGETKGCEALGILKGKAGQ